MTKDDYTEPDKNTTVTNKRQRGNKVPHEKSGTNRRTDWLLRFWTEVLIGVGICLGKLRMERTNNPRYGTTV